MAGAGALELDSPQSSIGLFMWEGTTHFVVALQAAGLNVSILLGVSRGHGPSSGRESHSPRHTAKILDPGHGGALSFPFLWAK